MVILKKKKQNHQLWISWFQISLRKQTTFGGDATTGFPRNDVRETSGEIPYWWRVTKQTNKQTKKRIEDNNATNDAHLSISLFFSFINISCSLLNLVSKGKKVVMLREKSTISVRTCTLLTCRNLFLFVIASFESPPGAFMGETRWYINGIGLFLSAASRVLTQKNFVQGTEIRPD